MPAPKPANPGLNRRSFLSAAAIVAAGGAALELFADARPVFANGPWGGYSNGYIPLSALVQINYPGVVAYQYSSDALPNVYMAPGASDQLLALLTAYHSATGTYLRVSEGYRTYAGQVYWHDHGSGGTPGQSNHGWGQAVDFDSGLLTSAQATWLANNGGAYGFYPLAGDYGHYNYTGTISGSGDMPQTYFTSNSTAMAVTAQGTWAAQNWQAVPYSGTAYNLGELLTSCSIFQISPTLYLTGLTAEKQLYMRLATQSVSSGVWSGKAANTVQGASNAEGRVYANFSGLVPLSQGSQRVALQVMSSHPGVTISYFGADIAAW